MTIDSDRSTSSSRLHATTIIIVVSPAVDSRGKRQLGRFDVRLQGVNEVICEATQQPLLDAARILLRRGLNPSNTICKVPADAPTVVTMKALIGVAAQFYVMGEKFVRRRPRAGPIQGSRTENPVSGSPVVPGTNKAALKASHNGSLRAANTLSLTSSAAPSPIRSAN